MSKVFTTAIQAIQTEVIYLREMLEDDANADQHGYFQKELNESVNAIAILDAYNR